MIDPHNIPTWPADSRYARDIAASRAWKYDEKNPKARLPLRLPLRWTDFSPREDGKGKRVPNNIDNVPFEFCVIDSANFVVARCSGPLVTMQSDLSTATARLFANAPRLLAAIKDVLNHPHIQAYLPYDPNDAVFREALHAVVAADLNTPLPPP